MSINYYFTVNSDVVNDNCCKVYIDFVFYLNHYYWRHCIYIMIMCILCLYWLFALRPPWVIVSSNYVYFLYLWRETKVNISSECRRDDCGFVLNSILTIEVNRGDDHKDVSSPEKTNNAKDFSFTEYIQYQNYRNFRINFNMKQLMSDIQAK